MTKLWVPILLLCIPCLLVFFFAGLDNLTFPNGTSITATVGDNVTIVVVVEANPMPNVTVTRVQTVSPVTPDASPLVAPALGVRSVDSRFNVSGNILMLTNVTLADAGMYTVEGSSLARTVSADFNLTVRCECTNCCTIYCVNLFNMYACSPTLPSRHNRSAAFLVSYIIEHGVVQHCSGGHHIIL